VKVVGWTAAKCVVEYYIICRGKGVRRTLAKSVLEKYIKCRVKAVDGLLTSALLNIILNVEEGGGVDCCQVFC
jgi:hypothetical protein